MKQFALQLLHGMTGRESGHEREDVAVAVEESQGSETSRRASAFACASSAPRPGLSQSDLAAGRFSKEYLSQIERGKTRPTAETVAWLAEQLGVDADLLVTGVSGERAQPLGGAARPRRGAQRAPRVRGRGAGVRAGSRRPPGQLERRISSSVR